MPKCPNCNAEVDAGAKFCMECGTAMPQNKKCPQCGTELPLAAKFCFGCGASMAGGNAPAAGLAMGDKNVVAGDVIGQKVAGDNVGSKVMGNIINNTIKDDTKSVNTCAICGVHMTNDTGHTCPTCGKVVCAEHFSKEHLCCASCAKPLVEAKAVEEAITSFTDPRDGIVYKTVKIGNQVWLAENFRYKCDGSYAYDDDYRNIKQYGRLYSWEAAKNCAPPGWHLPSRAEWNNLVSFIEANANSTVGTALKSKGGWKKENNIAIGADEFSFQALPAGCRLNDGSFNFLGDCTYFWEDGVDQDGIARYRSLESRHEKLTELYSNLGIAFSIRFLQDKPCDKDA